MLLCKTLHNGVYIKKLFISKFSSSSKFNKEMLIITENNLELFDYFYDERIQTPFLESKLKQELYLHILDVKTLKQETLNVIILLTTCGLIIMKYNQEINKFEIIASEVLNTDNMERDKLMYLSTNDDLGIITAYSNTNRIFIYKYFSEKIYLLNEGNRQTSSYILNVLIFSKFNNYIIEDKCYFHVQAMLKNEDKVYFENFYFDFSFKEINGVENNNVLKKTIYESAISPLGVYSFFIAEDGLFISKLDDTSFIMEINLKNCYLVSYMKFDDCIQFTFDNRILIFKEILGSKLITYEVTESCLFGRNVVKASETEYIFLYYDNNFNTYLIKYNFDGRNLSWRILKQFNDISFISIDSILMKTKCDNRLYSIIGLKGNSKLIRLEKTFTEVNIYNFEYFSVNTVNVIDFNDNKMILISSINQTKSFIYKNSEISDGSVNIDDRMICAKNIRNMIYIVCENNIHILNEKSLEKNSFNVLNIVLGDIIDYNNETYYLIYTSMNELELYMVKDNINLLSSKKVSSVSCINHFIRNSKLYFITSSYNKTLELHQFDKEFETKSYLDLSDIIHSINVLQGLVICTTRSGHLYSILIDDQNNLKLNYEILITEESEGLNISDVFIDKEITYVNLYNSNNCYMIKITKEIDNYKCNKTKYYIKDDNSTRNKINFFINLNDNMNMYQNNNKIYLSNFMEKSQYVPHEIKEFNYNQFARRMVNNQNTIYVLIQKYDENLILNNSIFIYDTITGLENVIILEDELIKINNLNIIDINFKHKNEDNIVKYLILCGEKNIQGIIYVYKINGLSLSLSSSLNFNNAIYDFCLSIDHLILAKENSICSMKIEINQTEEKIIFTPKNEQKYLNKIISIETVKDYKILVGDVNESFSLINFDPKKGNFEILAADISLRSLYKAFPIGEDEVILLEKNGCFTNFKLHDEVYKVINSFDCKQFINKCHYIQPYFFCTTLMGSVLVFKQISSKDLEEYNLSLDEINQEQNKLFKEYYKKIFNDEIKLEKIKEIRNIKNVLYVEFLNDVESQNLKIRKLIEDFNDDLNYVL